MLNKIIRYTLPFIILIGSLIIAFGLSNIEGATIITERAINYGSFTWTYKFIDFKLYLKNLDEALHIRNISGIIPSQPETSPMPTSANVIDWIKFIANSVLVYVGNWIIYAFNWLILAPIKVILYPIHLLLIILGINSSNDTYISIITSIYNFNLPYIPNF